MLAGSKMYTLETLFKLAHTKLSPHSPNWGQLTRDFEVNTTVTEIFSAYNHFLRRHLLLSTISASDGTVRNYKWFLAFWGQNISILNSMQLGKTNDRNFLGQQRHTYSSVLKKILAFVWNSTLTNGDKMNWVKQRLLWLKFQGMQGE